MSELEFGITGGEELQAVMGALDEMYNGAARAPDKKVGLVLLTFQYGTTESGTLNYISNGADRADIATLFKEMIPRLEGMPDGGGNKKENAS